MQSPGGLLAKAELAQIRWRTGLLLLAAIAVAGYLPILIGYVPFPADIVLFFPPWEGVAKTCCQGMQHAEQGDLVTQFYPWRTALNSGPASPLWNFHVLMGTPYAAMPQSGVFFAFNWLFAILSGPLAWSVLFPIRSAVVAVTTAVFVRRLGATNAAALLGGFSFALCGWVVAFQGRPQLDSAMWLPLMFLSVDWLREKPSILSIAAAALAFALPVLGGHPEIAFQVIVLGLLYALYRIVPLTPEAVRFVAAFGLAGVLSVMLAAAQLLPTIEWLGRIPRTLSLRWSLPPGVNALAFLSRDLFHQPNADGVMIPEGAAYAGVLALAALPFAWLWHRKGDVLFFAGLLVVCLELSYQWPPLHQLAQHIPVLAGLPNWRFLVGADFAVVVLASLGISALQARCGKEHSRPVALIVAIQAAGAAGLLLLLRASGATGTSYRWTLALLIPAVTIVALASTRALTASVFLRWTAVLVATDLLTFSAASIPFVKAVDIFPGNPVFDFLRQRAGPEWRVGSVDRVYGNNFEIAYGLSSAVGYDFPVTRGSRFLAAFVEDPLIPMFHSERMTAAPKGALDLTGTRYFVATTWNQGVARLAALPGRFHKVMESGTSQVFENPDAVPLVSFVPASAMRVVENEDDQLKAVMAADFDARRVAIVPAAVGGFSGVRGEGGGAAVDGVSRGVDEVRAGVTAAQDGLVLFSETYYPGWIAEVDGVAAPVIRANYTFMAVAVTQGRHAVRFRFAPRWSRVGNFVSGGAGLLVLGVLALGWWGRSTQLATHSKV